MAIQTRRRLIRLSLFTLVVATLNACGQKGPLYLPGEEEEENEKKRKKTTAHGRPGSSRA